MSGEIGLVASGYALTWLAILAGFAYAGYRLSQPEGNKIKVDSNDSVRNYRPPSGRAIR